MPFYLPLEKSDKTTNWNPRAFGRSIKRDAVQDYASNFGKEWVIISAFQLDLCNALYYVSFKPSLLFFRWRWIEFCQIPDPETKEDTGNRQGFKDCLERNVEKTWFNQSGLNSKVYQLCRNTEVQRIHKFLIVDSKKYFFILLFANLEAQFTQKDSLMH